MQPFHPPLPDINNANDTRAPNPEPVKTADIASGSKRRRLWELPERAHCPVVGVCLPIAVLRRVAEKVFKGRNADSDYGLHSGAVSECRKRTVLADGMQRELEKRYALPLPLRQAMQLKTAQGVR